MGEVIWVVLAVALLIGVVISGEVPAIGPYFWWTDLLFTSVVFLGFPGWVLADIAWRKTKRGEPGFKLGVAGGVMTALTGIMLLPGVLAIIGGCSVGANLPLSPALPQLGNNDKQICLCWANSGI
jgi:hypothetical protein